LSTSRKATKKDFFISYNAADKNWAEWIAAGLEKHGFSTVFQGWDFGPGVNFVLEMDRALKECERVILVLSPAYLGSVYTQPEWAGAFVWDPKGTRRLLFPIRVLPCEPEGLLKAIVYSDLVGLKRGAALKKLIADANGIARAPAGRAVGRIAFPGGPARGPDNPSTTIEAARRLYDILQTTRTTFYAQVRLRNQLVESARQRLKVTERYQYEPFFEHFFARLNREELRLHGTIRSYTAEVLAKYNARALKIVRQHPELADRIPSIPALRDHLIIWLAKYRRHFAAKPWMALVYVGVEEAVPFPKSIDQELRSFVRGNVPHSPTKPASVRSVSNKKLPTRRSTRGPLRRHRGEGF